MKHFIQDSSLSYSTGVQVKLGSDKDFELKTTEQIEAMMAQREVYLAEEKALKVCKIFTMLVNNFL